MVLKHVFRPACIAAVVVMCGLLSSSVLAADRSDDKDKAAAGKTVELFAAMESGEIDVKFIPKDSKQATVLIENKGDEPLRVKLPEAFAGVPVLAQMMGGGMGGMGMGGGGMGMGGGGMGGMGGGMGMQGMGGGMGGMGMGGMGGGGMGGMGMGGMGMGGMFNVRPGKVGKFKVTTVCLEHGKTEPSPRVEYKLVPIEKFTKNPEVIEICKMLGYAKGEREQLQQVQLAAQAATWHYTDKLSWEELASKVGVKHIHGPSEPFFSQLQLKKGLQIAMEAGRRVRENPAYNDPAYKDKVNSLSSQ